MKRLLTILFLLTCMSGFGQGNFFWSHRASINIPCDDPVTYSGGESYPTTEYIELGTATGDVYINFNTRQLPDQFYVYYDGVLRYGSAYRGDLSYGYDTDNDSPGYYRQDFIDALASRTDPQWGTSYPDFSHYPWDGYPNVYQPAIDRDFILTKSNAIPTILRVEVYGPMEGTAWSFDIECPQ